MGRLTETVNKESGQQETGRKPRLQYHTFFADYSGDSPEDVIQAVHIDSERVTGLNLDQWWAYQAELWDFKYGLKIPDPREPDAAAKLLDIFVEIGALENGPRPALKTPRHGGPDAEH